MRNLARKLLLSGLLAVLCLSCGGPPSVVYYQDHQNYDRVVAKAGDHFEITMAQLYDSLYSSRRLSNGGVADTGWVRSVLDSILVDTLKVLAAKEIPLEEHYDHYGTYRLRLHDAMIDEMLQKMVYDQVKMDSQAIVDYYHENERLFWLPEQVFVRHILVSGENLRYGPDSAAYKHMSDEQLHEATQEYAGKLKRMIDFGEPFSEVVRSYSHDVDAPRTGGLIGWTARNRFKAPFDSVAFGAEPGEVTEPYYDGDGWHILKIEDYIPEGVPPLDEVHMVRARDAYRKTMQNRRSRELRDSLNALPLDVEYNEEVLAQDPYKVNKRQWAAVVNGVDTISVEMLRGSEAAYRSTHGAPSESADVRREMINQLAERFVAVQAARDLGIDTLPAIKQEEQRLHLSHAKLVVEQNLVDPEWTPSDSLIRAYYDAHLDEFKVDKPMNLTGLMVGDSSYADFLRDQARSGFTFRELVAQFAGNEPGMQPYLLEYGDVSKEEVDLSVWQAASLTPIGDISDPVRTPSGFVIVKVVSREEPRALHRVAAEIRGKLIREHELDLFRRYRNELYEKYDVSFPNPVHPVHLRPLKMRRP